jgi:hypothetical protein
LFTLDWLESPQLRRRATAELNKGEAVDFEAVLEEIKLALLARRGERRWGRFADAVRARGDQALAWRRNEKFATLAYIRPMIRPLPLIAGSLGVLFFFAAAMYSLVPAGDLPSFFPGFETGSAQFHVKHAIGSFVIALVLFAFAWRQVFSRGDL